MKHNFQSFLHIRSYNYKLLIFMHVTKIIIYIQVPKISESIINQGEYSTAILYKPLSSCVGTPMIPDRWPGCSQLFCERILLNYHWLFTALLWAYPIKLQTPDCSQFFWERILLNYQHLTVHNCAVSLFYWFWNTFLYLPHRCSSRISQLFFSSSL